MAVTVGELLDLLKDEPEDCQVAIPYSDVDHRTSDDGKLMMESPRVLSRIWQPMPGEGVGRPGHVTLIILSGIGLPELKHRVVQGDEEMPN